MHTYITILCFEGIVLSGLQTHEALDLATALMCERAGYLMSPGTSLSMTSTRPKG